MKTKPTPIIFYILIFIATIITLFSAFSLDLRMKIIQILAIPCTILVIIDLLRYHQWVAEGFRLAQKGDELQLQGFRTLSEDILRLYKYAHTHTTPTETIEEKNKIYEEIKKLEDKVKEMEKTSKDNENNINSKVETMGNHFKFLLWFIPIALTIIGLLIAIGKIQLSTP